jgi:hypothetical protein
MSVSLVLRLMVALRIKQAFLPKNAGLLTGR